MNSKKNLKRNLLICLLAGSAVMYTLPLHAATSVVANNALPTLPMVNGQIKDGYGFVTGGNNTNIVTDGLQMNITQNDSNAAIKWGSFDVGGSATVNFDYTGKSDFNTLNYVNSASASQIYGTINAQHEGYNGNIFVINPAGVQIGPSAQINVGSLYVSNKYLNESEFDDFNGSNINSLIDTTKTANAELMSLGNINAANNVTFDGNRIVLDTDRVIITNHQNGKLNIKTTDTNNVVLGYEAYDENNGYTDTVDNEKSFNVTKVTIENGTIKEENANVKGYMWVEDVKQLQAIGENAETLTGNYALRNSIDATGTEQSGFNPIGLNNYGKVIINNEGKYGFSGKFDGIDYNIFGLTIDRSDEANVGLFGVAHDANINNVTLVGGSITGGSVVGSVVGAALGNTHITNATNSASVTGNTDVGGIVGYSGDKLDNVGDSGSDITGIDTNSHFTNLVNTGIVHSKGESDGNGGIVSNAGGLIGYMYNGKLDGNSYNLGNVSGDGYNVGGLVGHAENSTIGDGTNLVYNRLDVEGAYNVGGIVGNMVGTTVQNAENSGNVMATGYDTENYIYNTANTDFDKTHGENNDGVGGVEVNVANVGGIAGNSSNSSTIENVTNTGNVNSNTDTYEHNHTYYTAGNVGGVVGRAENTNITNATNRENEVRGAHNVGGVAGYFSGIGTVDGGINDGGDIMATGARAAAGVNGNVVNEAGFAREQVRPGTVGDETFIIGNMGGVVGYMDGDNVYVTGSANRGTVHSEDITDPGNILYISQAANTGGIVGKINRNKITDGEGNILTNEAILAGIKEGSITAAVTDSYNTGDVTGYSGVGGVVGMMYNGEVADSYNLGSINTTRKPKGGDRTSVNMGGVVGDTTEGSGASAVIYNVYNKGQIGDDDYETYARHVGGIVGRLSGIVDKSYNTGAIYNGYSVVGGIAGWFYEGTISNSFNTGNITVNNKETLNSGTQVGGIVGGIGAYNGSDKVNAIYNAYNLGTIRSFNDEYQNSPNNVGGIVGKVVDGGSSQSTAAKVEIKNVYTTSNIYSSDDKGAGSIYGNNEIGNRLTVDGANYIYLGNSEFTNLDNSNPNVNKVDYGNRYNSTAYNFVELNTGDKIWDDGNGANVSDDVNGANVSEDAYWRIYKNEDGTGTTPILNAFLPNAEDYFSGETGAVNPMEGISSIQYGTAYDPLLTIIKANEDLTFDWGALGIQNDGGLAVYNAGLTLTDFKANGGTGYFGGIIYADEALNLNGTNDIALGSASQIYGSDVTIETNGKVTIYGDVTSTGNQKDNDTTGNITINASDVDVYGTLTSAKSGQEIQVSGIADSAVSNFDFGDVDDKAKAATDIGKRFAHTTGESAVDGNITITANGTADGSGNVNLYFGNKQEGLITTDGNLEVTGTGDVYVDSDLDIGGDLTLEAGAGNEALLDITNIGQVQNNHDNEKAKETLHNFLDHFATNKIIFGETQDAKITVDMWNGNNLDLEKFDDGNTTLVSKLNSLNVDSAGDKTAKELTHIWVNIGEQLKNIQTADDKALDYNFALKGDINASDVENYVAIGTGSEFTGTFDGRGNRIIGLDTTKSSTGNGNTLTNAGIFSTIGEGGTVKNVNIYSGNFEGTNTAGSVAGMNSGRIENVTGFGNTVTVTGASGNAGGIVGVNNGKSDFAASDSGASTLTGNGIYDVQNVGSVIAGGNKVVAGGLVGLNAGALGNSYSDSAVTVKPGVTLDKDTTALGGVVGVNTENGDVRYVDSLGITNGGTNSSNVGGIIGVNKGNMYSGYNESIVSGKNNVGGIIGDNDGGSNYTKKEDGTVTWSKGTVENVVNATGVTGTGDYEGGLVGTNIGSVENGRNNGTITGHDYVGGLVGNNADVNSILSNLTNDSSAEILGVKYVGGIAGSNSGTISATDDALINRGSITGHRYVGGVAGTNTGTITNTNNDVELNVNTTITDEAHEYFGGVVGQNSGTIESATNRADIVAKDAKYVGGIVGYNTKDGKLQGMGNSNEGRVEGASYVGGVAGKNEASITGEANDLVTIDNSGVVIAHEGGAGGIFGENTGNIKYAELTNNGIVFGTYNVDKVAGTGGLIGVNSGEIKHSSLKNNIGGQVIGTQNVGGLIGVNTGNIEGGRNEQEVDKDGKETVAADSYYKYQIYNNGTITANGNGSNIGGLFGTNSGNVEAAYNTGAINASGSTNIGGIAGVNEQGGELDQVFNTVMTADGQNAITGGNNVGGLVGTNSGTLCNAYNTTGVEGATNFGNAVGENSGTITNIYASNTSGNLIGTGYDNGKVTNAYSFSNDDNDIENITVIAEDNRQNSDSYNGFDFDNTGATKTDETAASDGDKDYWKIYSGSGNPLLKVFLTTVTVDTDKLPDIVYNTKDQDLNIGSLTGTGGAFSAADDFKAYQNNNSLIQNTDFEHKNAGTYDNWLYSGQIASGSQEEGTFNPNNLGYDIEFKADIDKAQITVDLNEVERTYGDTTILNNGNYNYSYDFANVTDETDLANLRNELNNNDVLSLGNVDKTKDDGGLVGDGTKTNNAGDYNWTGTVNIVDGYQGNYEFVLTTEQSNDNQSSLGTNGTSITTIGDSIVDKRQLSISDIIANIMYGNQNGSGFIITSGGTLVGVNSEEGIVYDDDVTLDTILSVTDANIVAGSSYADNKGNRVTADVGTYKDSLNLSGLQLTGDDAKNYELADTSVGGTIVVNKATITLDLSDVNRTYGNANITSGGYDVVNVNNNDVNGNNTNGDSYDANDFIVIVNNGDDGALTGNTEGRVTNDVGSYTYTGTVTSDNEKLNQNYDIVVNNSANDNNVGTGNSYVNKADLIININDVETTYGTAFDESKYGYGFGNNGANGLVNGDVLEDVKDAIDSAAGGYENTGAADSTNGKVTQDAKDGYSLSFNNELSNTNTLKNYNIITVNNGDSTVNKKQITIGANDEQILVGETPNYSGTDIDSVLVNGDSLNGNYHYGVEDSSIESVVGTHNDAIGVWIGGSFYDLSNPDWSNLPGMSFFANYNVTFEPGTLTVSAYDIPEDWPHNRWDYLFNDAPFDRNKDFRERKAEVNFVDGGMEI